MKHWLILLAGLLFWAAHFGLIYLIASVSIQAVGTSTPLARMLIVGSGVVCVAALAALCFKLPSGGDEMDQFGRSISLAGALIAMVAIIWQSVTVLAPGL